MTERGYGQALLCDLFMGLCTMSRRVVRCLVLKERCARCYGDPFARSHPHPPDVSFQGLVMCVCVCFACVLFSRVLVGCALTS